MIAFVIGPFVSLFVVCQSFSSLDLLRGVDKRIVNTMKVYIERNNMQFE